MKQKHIYSIPVFDEVGEGRKVGDAFDVLDRIKGHQNATTPHYTSKVDLILPEGFRDYDVHEFLKADPNIIWDGEAHEGRFSGREVFFVVDGFKPSYIDEQVSRFVAGDTDFYKRNLSYALYPRQREAHDWALSKFRAGEKRILVEAVPRFGKTFVALKIAKSLGVKSVLILTPFPDADKSFSELIRKHVDFAGASYQDLRDGKPEDSSFTVVKASWQFLGDEKESCKSLFTAGVDFIIIDETHRASDTERSEDYLKQIPHNYELHLSGTPYVDKLTGRFTEDAIWSYDVIDQLRAIREASKDSPLAKYPLPELYLIDGMAQATQHFKAMYPNMQIEDNLTLEKFFTAKYEPLVEMFFRNLTTSVHDPLARRFMTDSQVMHRMNHILLFAPSLIAADLITRVLQKLTGEGGGWGGYYVAAVSGIEEVGNFKSVETEINRLQAAYAKTITVSVGKATTGVTLEKLSAIWILRKMNSAEQFVQTLFRAGTPYEGKDITPIVCFDSESVLAAQAVVSMQHARRDGAAFAPTMKTLYECLPTFVWSAELQFQSLAAEAALAFVKEIKPLLDAGEFEIDDLPEDFLSSMKLAKRSVEARLGVGGQEGGKTAQRSGGTPKTRMQQKVEMSVRAKILQVLGWLDWVVTGCAVQTVEQLLAISEAECNVLLQVTKAELALIVSAVGASKIQEQLDIFNSRILAIS